MESNYEVGDRIELKYPYVDNRNFIIFIPSGEFILLVDGPYKIVKYGSIVFSWNVLAPHGELIRMTEDYF